MSSSSVNLAGLGILIVEDELMLRKQLAATLERLGADVTQAGQLDTARKFLERLSFDVVLLDVNLPDGLGTELLRQKQISATSSVIIMTAHGGVEGAVEALRLGAADYLVKPFDPGELPLVINRVRKAAKSARVDEHRRGQDTRKPFYFGAALAPLEAQLQKILAADRRMQQELPPVLIHGETGTGKTTIARLLHQQGPRADQPMVEVNCSALPEQLAESELFGHERGAFTDARTTRLGLFEAADGGTLFLDELPSLPAGLQAKVLTAIEDRKIRRLGSNKELPVDVRIVAATNRDLRQLVAKGEFREDLYHRLDLYRLHIPPLRERGEDILQLADTLIQLISQRHRLPVRPVQATGRQRLLHYAWPGNVRELAHELERAIVFEESDALEFTHLTSAGMPVVAVAGQTTTPDGNDWFNERYRFPAEGFVMEEAINRLIRHALAQTFNNVSAAARLLGVSRDYLRYRLNGNKPAPEGGE